MRRNTSDPLRRLSIPLAASLTAAAALAATASPAAASVTIGQLAPGSSPATSCTSQSFDRLQLSVTSGNTYVVPANGTITSWSTNAGAGTGQRWAMKVFRQFAGLPSAYTVGGHDSHALAPGLINTFAANVPVRAGDLLGLNQSDGGTGNSACTFPEGGVSLFRLGNLADGASDTFNPAQFAERLNIRAVVEPSNSFTLGELKRNKKKGTATLTVDVPNPGQLALFGKRLKNRSEAATAPGEVTLRVKAKGKKKRNLNRKGKVTVKPSITFTPTGGDPSTQSRKLKLKRR